MYDPASSRDIRHSFYTDIHQIAAGSFANLPLKDDWPTTRMVASQSLSGFGAPAVPALLAQLDAAESNVREAAADALWKIGAPRNVPALPKLVGLWLADLGSVRVAAGNGLRTIGRSALIALPDFLLDLSHPKPSRRQETAALILTAREPDSWGIPKQPQM